MTHRLVAPACLALSALALPASAQPALLDETAARALASELSGETAKRNLEFVARHHRTRGSRPFRAAADFIVERLRAYGLSDARVEELPADGTQWYGTQRARPAWDAELAELWEVRPDGDDHETIVERVGSGDAMPIVLAQDSESADVRAELVDVGEGSRESDYAGRDVRGRIVLAAAQPGPVAELAVARYGAVGIISYAQNQRTAWSGDDDTLVRWGHLETFAPHTTFGFMISLRQARAFQQRLRAGETILLRARVKAGRRPGAYSIVTATIPGADPQRRRDEIVFSCHLDHPRPGANDNASGCMAILEVARTYAALIEAGRLVRPARTLRFVWPPEIEGTIAYLNARPEIASRIRAAIHLDMVGGSPETQAVFHVTRGPASRPSFVNDVAASVGAFVNEQTTAFAGRGSAGYPLTAPEGGKEPLRAALVDFTSGSDHQVYTEGSFGIPAVYLNDWPDRYIHTNRDTAAMIDPTKLLRAAFIAGATGWILANLGETDAPAIFRVVRPQVVERTARILQRMDGAPNAEAIARFHLWHERALIDSIAAFAGTAAIRKEADTLIEQVAAMVGRPAALPPASGDSAAVFVRAAQPKGPMSGFGYEYLPDKLGAARASALALTSARARWGNGDYGYEALNLVDGRRSVAEITDMVSAIYGPVPLASVLEYLLALEEIGVVRKR